MANRYFVPIPEPTEEGKVLTVVNGEWQSASPSGGGMVVNVIADTTIPTNITLDKNYQEISAAIASGITPVFLKTESETSMTRKTIYTFWWLGEGGIGGIESYFITLMKPIGYNETDRYIRYEEMQFESNSLTGVLTFSP